MKLLESIWDGDDGPVYPFQLKGPGAASIDMSRAAVEFYIYDRDGAFVARRPGLPVSPKSNGTVNLMLLGRETDWDGAGRVLILKPKVHLAVDMDGHPATNLLLNPSFDTAAGTLPARIATDWALFGTRTAIWDNYVNDAYPPSIFGTFQLVKHATVSPLDPDYIQQVMATTLSPGDRVSVGCWHRVHTFDGAVVSGDAKNNNHAIFFRCGSQANSYVQFEIVTSDWYFAKGSVVTPTAENQIVMGLDARGSTLSQRYDEAFCFVGEWLTPIIEPRRIVVRPRRRVVKTQNQIAGIGGFEEDSDGDGLADAWAKHGTVTTYAIERSPVNVHAGSASQMVSMNNASVDSISVARRGKFLWGETWQASVRVKTDGPLAGSGGGAGFGLHLQTQYFDRGPVVSDFVPFGSNVPTFTEYSTLITMPEDQQELLVTIFLCGYTGTVWLDDARLVRIDE